MRNFELPGRSPVHSTHGMAATSHPLATLAALDVLRAGGNAMDAAIAACAVLCVVEPQSTGIGGDCFCLYASGDGNIRAYNGSGWAPRAVTAEILLSQCIHAIDPRSPHAVTVPGAVDAWCRLLDDYGTKDIGEVLQPAIRYARDGYPVHSRVAFEWRNAQSTLRNDEAATQIFMPTGDTPPAGALHFQPALGTTLERIANEDRDGFYRGVVAEEIVARLVARGGLHTLDDFATYEGEYVTPIQTTFHGHDIYECPPNGQGVIALLILNIVAGLEMRGLTPLSVERVHLMIEAARLAYRDRNIFVGDPRMSNVPVAKLLSSTHAASLRTAIRRDRALDALPTPIGPEHEDTVYLCVVDENRNAVSFINSLFHAFGTGILAPNSGVMLQNRGAGFVVEVGHPNCIAPHKRPLHTIIPGMVVKDGRPVMPFGVMGGQYQAMGHAWFLTNFFDFGLDVQEAIDLPRVFPTLTGPVEVEGSVPAEVSEGLKRLGHVLTKPRKPIGGGQAIFIDWDSGVLTGGSEPRKDGLALGY